METEFKQASQSVVCSAIYKFLAEDIQNILEEVQIDLKRDTKTLRFNCPSATIAARLFKKINILSLAIYGLKESLGLDFIPKLEIFCIDQQFIPQLNPQKLLKDSFMTSFNENQQLSNLIGELDLDLNELYRTPHPVYITQMSDQKVLFANQIALLSNNRSASDMVGKEATPLWDDEVLAQLMQLLESDKELWQYSYPGYRWARQESSPIWRRERYMFVANYKLVEFLGSLCRFCVITSAEKIQPQAV
ncbi:hypothetical protein [Microcoleus sp. S13C4]|uniref:hypothetical protein n=1 Tax=Microcoleus sp. S13C4 TaxID=3055410 RepID=UPI002FD3FD63